MATKANRHFAIKHIKEIDEVVLVKSHGEAPQQYPDYDEDEW